MRTLFIACLLALMPYTVKGQMDTTTVRLLRKADSLMYVMWGRVADEMVTRSDVRRMIDSALKARDEVYWIIKPGDDTLRFRGTWTPTPDSCMKIDTVWVEVWDGWRPGSDTLLFWMPGAEPKSHYEVHRIDTTWVECKPQHKEVR